ncbi:hypothetical protein CHS0354_005894 [Potamilus streckersoni]|uniref:3-oxoacyl-[acyl-carrier-protein] reductase n=1 Tax=Potamilus streckersoni TaxID=2493646 RepID=A0AAE0T878_9BIVA|nr:hypothetical protein CHS0354_005894 [Potamilus streckersoni]
MDGKIALITGSTRGIGLGIARRLAENGCYIVLTGLGDQQSIDKIVQEFQSSYSVKVNFVPGDLRDPSSIRQLCEKVTELYPEGIDILLNNAGIQHVAAIDEYPVEKWDDMMAISLTAPFYLIRHFLPYMKKKGWGRIINTASQMAVISAPGKAPYSAAKAGLVGLTKGVALEAAEYGVTCNAICPGFADTQILEGQARMLSEKMNITCEEAKQKFFASKHPTQKLVEINQIAGMVLFLCSPDADNVTGSSLMMDGGFTIQ